ncbi:hypothetical protein D3C76_1456960 [compost metagenome]
MIAKSIQQVAQTQASIRSMQQQRVELSLIVVGDNQVKVIQSCAGNDLWVMGQIERDQLVGTRRRGLPQREVTGQRGLAVQIQQQHA